ncbi:PREDICTED: uncharacterized protein LOC104720097 [Camelina sativa]|uniref:Uncharacterized protein LOC104720097 n=1 Tax=Camelina sativa TaxID=90675 RepID=A0ABM0U5Z9_CAMSA|nr:PREDICTED: uncharacterized protein LOC104720097 [Camelina sativa]
MGNTYKDIETSKSLNDQTLISPYFLHASDHTGQVQTPILLNGSNYERWAKLMTNSLHTKRKLGFINGTLLRSTTDPDEAERWDMVNSMIIGWIYSSIEPYLRSSISVVSDASVMWAALKGRFSTSDDTRVRQLRAELAACRQDGRTVEEYFGKLKVYWDDPSDFEAAFTCCCGNDRCSSMIKHRKIQDKTFNHQFLTSLDNNRFGTARSNLLSRLCDLTLESVYSQIKQEETHLNTTRRTKDKSSVIGFSATSATITKPNTSMTCTHCGRTGHEKQQCFKVVGYPECSVIFTKRFCAIHDQASRILIVVGEKSNGVYHLTGVVVPQAHRVGCSDVRALWHMRLGHPSSKVLSFLSDLGGFSYNVSDLEELCDTCLRAKQTRVSFQDSSNKADDLFSMIHYDVKGPYREKSTTGASYFLTIVDDFSRAVWTHLLLEKSQVADVLKNFLAFVHRQFNKQVKIVRSDNVTEFLCLRKFFDSQGIIHQTSCVATPQQNGRVERKHRHILNVVRSLLLEAKLPARFWGESILAATHLINCTPSVLLLGKSPFEVLFQKPPAYDDLRTFGCLYYAHKVRRSNDKFKERGVRCMFLGYPFGKKGWIVFDFENDKTFVSRDAIFHENVFPFHSFDSSMADSLTVVSPSSVHPSFFDDIDSPSLTGGASLLLPLRHLLVTLQIRLHQHQRLIRLRPHDQILK